MTFMRFNVVAKIVRILVCILSMRKDTLAQIGRGQSLCYHIARKHHIHTYIGALLCER